MCRWWRVFSFFPATGHLAYIWQFIIIIIIVKVKTRNNRHMLDGVLSAAKWQCFELSTHSCPKKSVLLCADLFGTGHI